MSRYPRSVLLFIETGGPGGAERVVVSLAQGLAASGILVTTCSLRQGWMTEQLRSPGSVAAGISYFPLRSSRSLDVRLPFRLAQLAWSVGAEVIHSHLLDSNFYAALGAQIARIPHLGTEHGDIHHIHRRRFLSTKLKLLSLLGTQFSAVSQYTAEALIAHGINRNNIQCIGNPIEFEESAQDPAERLDTRAELGINQEDQTWLWLHVANFRPVKDQATLIKGFAAAAHNSSQRHMLALVGDGDLRASLEALARAEGVGEQVRFLGFRNDVGRLLNAADGFILSSISEALPMAILEAARAGLVVVSSAVGGVPEIIVPGKTGFLFPPGNATALGQVLQQVVADQAVSRTIALHGQTLVRERFSTKQVVRQFLDVYQRLLA